MFDIFRPDGIISLKIKQSVSIIHMICQLRLPRNCRLVFTFGKTIDSLILTANMF